MYLSSTSSHLLHERSGLGSKFTLFTDLGAKFIEQELCISGQ